MESLANDLDRSMTKTLARIGDKVGLGGGWLMSHGPGVVVMVS